MKSTTLSPVEIEPGAQRMGLYAHCDCGGLRAAGRLQLTSRLGEDGFAVVDGPRRTGDGYYESVVLDPDGNRIEITA